MPDGPCPEATLRAGLAALGLDATPDQLARWQAHLALVARWNRVYNLTRITTPADMCVRHLLDSLSVAPHLRGGHLVDVGSGAGFPGLPLAVLHPEWHVTLVDAAAKRVRFLRQAVLELGLDNVTVVQGRVVELALARPADEVICRAFADLAAFVADSRHLLRPGGRLLAMKGALPEAELSALPEGIAYTVTPLAVPGLSARRHLISLIPDHDQDHRHRQPEGGSG